MRIIFPACAAGTIGLSICLMGALVAPGPTALPTVSHPADNGRSSGQSVGLDDLSERHGPAGQFVLSGRIVDAATGDPIRGADVNVVSDDNGGCAASTTTNQRGEWRLHRLPTGSYHATVRKAEYQMANTCWRRKSWVGSASRRQVGPRSRPSIPEPRPPLRRNDSRWSLEPIGRDWRLPCSRCQA